MSLGTWLQGIVGSVMGSRSLENPNVSLNDPAVWESLGGGITSAAGVTVSAESALRLDTLWRGVNLIAGYCGRVPLLVYQADRSGWDRAVKHPAYALLKREPLTGMTARVFKKTLTANAILHGAGYAYIVRDRNARPLELWPLDSGSTLPLRVNRSPWYVTTIGTEQRRIPAYDMLVISGLSKDGWMPYSIFDKARDSIGLGLAQEKYASKFFSNNAEPRVVIEVPVGVVWQKPAQEEFLRQWNLMHQGLDSSHKTAILTQGAQAKPFSINSKDAQLLESRKFTAKAIANWLGIPPHKLGDDGKTSYGSIEQENQSLLDDCLEEWFCAWEEECEAKLLTEEEKSSETAKVEFVRRKLARPGLLDRAQAFNTLINARVLSPNEVRAEEGYNPYDGGDEYLVPANIGNPGGNPGVTDQGGNGKGDGEGTPEADPAGDPTAEAPVRSATDPAIASAHRELLIDACGVATRRLTTQARREAQSPRTFSAWLDVFAGFNREALDKIIRPAVAAVESLRGVDASRTTSVVSQLITTLHDDLLRITGECREKELPAAVDMLCKTHEANAPAALVDAFFTQRISTELKP